MNLAGLTFTFSLPLGRDHIDPDDIDLAGEAEAQGVETVGPQPMYLPDNWL